MARNIEILKLAVKKRNDPAYSAQVARKAELRPRTPYNYRSVNDDEREEIEMAMATRT